MITSAQSYNCAHIAQDCPLDNLIQTQLQDKNGVKRILVIVGYIKVSTFLKRYLKSYISYKFVNILKTSFHKFLVLISFKNSKNGTIKIYKKT